MITVVGARDLWPVPTIASAVLNIMIAEPNETYAIRASRGDVVPSGTEDLVDRIGARLNIRVLRWKVADGTFNRDEAMVKASKSVHAFFAPNEVMKGGTGHIVTVALRLERPVVAYTLADDGSLEIIAEEGELSAWL